MVSGPRTEAMNRASPQTNGANTGSRKRKADGDFGNAPNPHLPKKSKPSKSRSPAPARAKDNTDAPPFIIQCPAKAIKSSSKTNDVFRALDHPGIEDLRIEYAVRPGSRWQEMRSYRNVKLNDQTFREGDIVYVNRSDPPPPRPSSDAPQDELLRHDKENMWIAKIMQTKAESDKQVNIRVFWLYWPDELPMGRQPYHGASELVMSNAMDIIDAQTIAGPTNTSQWNEEDDGAENGVRELFWRQTFDITKLGKSRKGGLSRLRKHCICNSYYNPDSTMYKCARQACGIWNHESCLTEDISRRAWAAEDANTLNHFLETYEHLPQGRTPNGKRSLGSRILQSIGRTGHAVAERIIPIVADGIQETKQESQPEVHAIKRESDDSISSPMLKVPVVETAKYAGSVAITKSSKSATNGSSKPWLQRFTATILEPATDRLNQRQHGNDVDGSVDKSAEAISQQPDHQANGNSDVLLARLVPSANPNELGQSSTDARPKELIVRVECLKCRHLLD